MISSVCNLTCFIWCRMIDLSTLSPAEITLIGSLFSVLLTMHFTMQLLSQHLFYWKNPKEQRAILIIILMAPVYAINSFVGLLDAKGSKPVFMFLDSVKECYEALVGFLDSLIFHSPTLSLSLWLFLDLFVSLCLFQVIAKFLALMFSYLNISMTGRIIPDEIKGREIHHSFPITLFVPRTTHLDHRTLKQLKQWTWQFCIIRPVCSILMRTLQLLGIYPAWLSWIFTVILNVSASLALYSLVKFYHVFAKELEPHKPLTKFMCVKGIVFFCFWQVNT